MNYAPKGKPAPVCGPGEFVFAATALDHGHIGGQCNGLVEAGGDLRWVYDPDPEKVAAFQKSFPQAKAARSLDEIFQDQEVKLVAAAAVPNLRGDLGCRVMEAGRDYFTDKTPFTTMDQLARAREAVLRTGKKYMVYYSERLHVECAVVAGQLVADGAIGRVLQVMGTGPHRLNAPSRPSWFFDHEQYGGILCDIGSHQCEQFLYFSGATDARLNFSAVGNFGNPAYPELEDFGEASFTADNGASGYFRCDWFTPDGLRTWGDGRTVLLGTEGYIEMRKYIDVTSEDTSGNHLYLVDKKGEYHIPCEGTAGYPFFGQLILDCINRTETAMTQAHAFKAAELCIKAQDAAVRLA
ncbi:MAG: Gfo/Idh/MocA family protein [Terrimicrobiaceae bacterium]